MKSAKPPLRRRWWETASAPPPAELAKLMENDPGRFSDLAFWLPNQHREWFDAFADVDRSRDQHALIALLRPLVPEPVRPYYDDFFKRNEIRNRQRGRPATPKYDMSPAFMWCELASEKVRELVAAGQRVDDAIKKARRMPFVVIPFTTLKNHYLKKSRRPSKKRRRSPRAL